MMPPVTPPIIKPVGTRRPLRLTYTATRATQALTSGAPPIDPETGRQYPILKLWAVQPPTVTPVPVFPAPFPTGVTYTYVGGIVSVEVSMEDGGTDQRYIQVGVRPCYLRVGKYQDVSVKTTQYVAGTATAWTPTPGGPIYSMWCREANVPNEVPLPRYPDLVYSAAGTSALQIVPNGAVRIMVNTSTVISWLTAAGPNNPAVIDEYTQPLAAWTWYPVMGDVFKIQGPATVFMELDPL